MKNVLDHDRLDELLGALESPPERFEERVNELICELDESDTDLEIVDPHSYRRGTAAQARHSFPEQFRIDVERIVLLDREEEARLARRIEFARLRLAKAKEQSEPDRIERREAELHALRTELVERNLYLVLINVERYKKVGANRIDLMQEGCISLYRAVDGFDWRRGLLFRTYAVHWLNQAFRNYLYNHTHTVRVPVYLQKALKHINQASIRLGKMNPTADEIAGETDLRPNVVRTAIKAARTSFSIDADLSREEGSRLRDLLVDETAEFGYNSRFEDLSLEDGLKRALKDLNERESLVVRMRFGIGYENEHTLAEVASVLGVSVERVRQIQVRAIAKLDTPLLRRDLSPFLN